MSIERVAVVGATGMLGRPVAHELIAAGYRVTALSRNPARAGDLASQAVPGNVFDLESLRKAFAGVDAVYVNLSVSPSEKPSDPHAETHGLRNVIAAARECGVRRVALLSSLVKQHQGHEGFDWWVFDVKHQAARLLRESGIPSTVFYASSFFENFLSLARGGKIVLPGTSKHPIWFIGARDFGRQVARSFAIEGDGNRTYCIQGPEGFTYREAARVFVANYPREKLTVRHFPMIALQALGLFSRKFDYVAKIVEAMNEYPEEFVGQKTWDDLGKPQTTLAEWAKTAP